MVCEVLSRDEYTIICLLSAAPAAESFNARFTGSCCCTLTTDFYQHTRT
jgi:hypothetical protein